MTSIYIGGAVIYVLSLVAIYALGRAHGRLEEIDDDGRHPPAHELVEDPYYGTH